MVHLSNTFVIAALLVAPSIAIPISLDQNFQTRSEDIDLEVLAARDPSFSSWFRKVKKTALPVIQAAKIVAPVLSREIAPEVVERDMADFDFEELAARDPSFRSWFRKIKKTAAPVIDAAKLVAPVLPREDALEVVERDMADFELVARDPSFRSWFKKFKKTAAPVIDAAKLVAPILPREDASEVVERDVADFDFEELAARDPSFGSWFRKIKKAALPAVKLASLAIREETPEVLERDLADFDFEALAARDPSFGSWIRKVKKVAHGVVHSGYLGKYGAVAGLVIRDENAKVYERRFEGFEIDELD
ncbi:hypothetical protein B0H34DRAFT_502500 [Crassisporium funariophilum]|nr:hypothetical protein B0H34DRAFT_502500 [Crassisporium funariophilum]